MRSNGKIRVYGLIIGVTDLSSPIMSRLGRSAIAGLLDGKGFSDDGPLSLNGENIIAAG